MDMQTQTHGCPHCNRIFQQSEAPEEPEPVCESCRYLYPPALLKAAGDYFDYALRLSTGEIIRFRSAKIHGDYATLYGGDGGYEAQSLLKDNPSLPFSFDRGIDVRVSEIVWCADAPNGS